jgi:hypothetical protein
MNEVVPEGKIESKIHVIRGKRVMLDSDLAGLYGVTTGNLNKAVKRNLERFPEDFMIRLSSGEYDSLRFQFGILKRGQHAKYLPYAFTEQGIAMLSSVLNSKPAVQVNIQIMRTFTRIRQYLAVHEDLRRKIEAVEKKTIQHDRLLFEIFTYLKKMMEPPNIPVKQKGKMGF